MQHILSHTQVRVMICDQVRDTEKNVRATRCYVFTSRCVHTFANVCTRNLSKQKFHVGLERVCSHHSFSPMLISPLSAFVFAPLKSWCSCCHQCCEDDEEEVCDQWLFQFWLCHSRSARNASSNLCRILSISSEYWNYVVLVLVEELWEFS